MVVSNNWWIYPPLLEVANYIYYDSMNINLTYYAKAAKLQLYSFVLNFSSNVPKLMILENVYFNKFNGSALSGTVSTEP